jgi:hypothetical protein
MVGLLRATDVEGLWGSGWNGGHRSRTTSGARGGVVVGTR